MKRAGIWAALALALTPMLAAQTYEQLMKKGDGADVRGKTTKAARRYQEAIAIASTPAERVAALLAYTDTVRGTQPNKDLDASTAASIEDAFKRAITEATGLASFKAHNDYGVFLLDRGNAAAAVTVFADGEKNLEVVSDVTAARYLSNFALARYRSEQLDDALRTYRLAFRKDPSFAVPAVAAYTVIGRFVPARGAAEAVSLIELLMDGARLGLARTFIEKVMANEQWHSEAAPMERLLDVLVGWFVRTEATPQEIGTDWVPKLEHLADEFAGEAKEKVGQLLLVYEGGELPMSFDDGAEQRFSLWKTPDDRRHLALLLQQSADAAVAKNEPARAAERYIAAWKLNPETVEPLTSLADLLSSWESNDAARLLDRLVAVLFEEKCAALLAGNDNAALRLHMVLGSIFEAREQWGPRDDPRTASYQYAAALDAYDRLRRQPNATIYPGVNANFGAALAHIGDIQNAWSQYVLAAAANLQSGDVEAAELMIDRARETGYEPPEHERKWAQEFADAIAAKKSTAPLTDARIGELVRDRLAADPEVDASAIDVSVENGVVHLSGQATSEYQIHEATVAVQKTDGVNAVKIELAVPPPER